MSFRGRLTLFFIIIVIVPMVAIALLMTRLISESATGQARAAIAAEQNVAARFLKEERERAQVVLEDVVADDRVFVGSLQRNQLKRARKRARQLVDSPRGIERIVFVKGGRVRIDAGDKKAIAAAPRAIVDRARRPLGTLRVSVIDASGYVRQVRAITELHVVVRRGKSVLASTLPAAATTKMPDDGKEVSVGGKDYIAGSFRAADFGGQKVQVSMLGQTGGTAGKIRQDILIVGAILLGFFLAAIACALLVSKSLQEQILGLLGAARRLGKGDFSAQVPTVGRDEFAALGEEFNKMSRQLEARLEDLRKERVRVEGSMRRLGEAVASNLDRDALLRLVVRTAVDGVGADAGRVSVRGSDQIVLEELSRVGNMNGLEAAVQSVEAEALRSGSPQEATLGPASAIAHPLRARDGEAGIVGVVSIGRSGRAFTPQDRDLFDYLAGQASVSIENVGLHETVARESVTDELTGLSNRRGFDDALTMEIERSKRFGKALGLVLLDLDDFKDINDSYGHQQGDVVLRDVAIVLRETAREIDYPARYGGEEMAILLPETDVDGAVMFAERLRERIDALRIQRSDGAGTLHVTTSCGVASVPDSAVDERGLVAAADFALYEAKRSGKNMTVRAR
ncbi:MAG: diguanylate cyclase [Actinomycetota bacterium]|nr:diguanylate cyclase [Actinomycetota bacterium]